MGPPESLDLLRPQIFGYFYIGHVNIKHDMWYETILINAVMSIEFPTYFRNTGSMTMFTICQLLSATRRMISYFLYPTLFCKTLISLNYLALFCKPSVCCRTSISPKFAVQFPASESAAVSCRSVSTMGLASWLIMAHSLYVTTATATDSSKVRRPISSSQLSVKKCVALLRFELIYTVKERGRTCTFFVVACFWLLFNLVYWMVI